jgi:imidazole glycerol-phosphate synthase subunit HisH
MSVAIVDYGSGNLHSAHKAFERAASQQSIKVTVTSDPDIVRRADRIVLPGVGAFADCRRGLDQVAGMVDALEESVIKGGKPFLGICVGMQLLASRGLEHGIAEGLNWIPGDVIEIKSTSPDLKVPHMGWNTLSPRRDHALLKDISVGEKGLHAYFVHSYHLKTSDPAYVVASTEYGGDLTAVVGRDNIAGTQFHPEKSQKLGLALIANFLRWTP